MECPLVSVVTLTYKQFDYIYSTIKSVLEQNYPNIEYIIADDGSQNFPKKEIENFVKENAKENIKNFIIIDAKENVGTVKNINRAYKMAKGEYLMPLSGDDEFLDENSISDVIREFDKRKCEALITSRMACDENLVPLFYIPHLKERKKVDGLDTKEKQYIALVTYEAYEVMSGSVLYIKKKKIEEMGYFDENYRLLEDAPFFEKYLCNKKIDMALDIVSIKYRVGGVSSDKVNPILKEDFLKYYNNIYQKNCCTRNKKFKRRLEYSCSFMKHTSFIGRLICYMKRLDVFVNRFKYRIGRKLVCRYDKKHIECIKKTVS